MINIHIKLWESLAWESRGERDTAPCSSSAMALLDIGPHQPAKSLPLVREGGRNRGWGMELFTPTMPPPGGGVEVLFPWSYRSKHFPANTSVQVPGLRFQRPGLWSPPLAGFPDYEHLPLQFLYLHREVVGLDYNQRAKEIPFSPQILKSSNIQRNQTQYFPLRA